MFDLNQCYRRNENFVFRKIENETILVPIKDNVGDMGAIYNLNRVGAYVWERLDGNHSLLDVRNMLLDEFEVSPEETEKDLSGFVGGLRAIEAILPA